MEKSLRRIHSYSLRWSQPCRTFSVESRLQKLGEKLFLLFKPLRSRRFVTTALQTATAGLEDLVLLCPSPQALCQSPFPLSAKLQVYPLSTPSSTSDCQPLPAQGLPWSRCFINMDGLDFTCKERRSEQGVLRNSRKVPLVLPGSHPRRMCCYIRAPSKVVLHPKHSIQKEL